MLGRSDPQWDSRCTKLLLRRRRMAELRPTPALTGSCPTQRQTSTLVNAGSTASRQDGVRTATASKLPRAARRFPVTDHLTDRPPSLNHLAAEQDPKWPPPGSFTQFPEGRVSRTLAPRMIAL